MFNNIPSNFYIFLFLFLISIQSTLTLNCYECHNCTDIPSCVCSHTVDVNTSSYCILLRESSSTGVYFEIRHFPRNATTFYIYDPDYISVVERISYNDTTERWSSISDKITYGCQTDECNSVDLLKQLPANGLSLMLPSDWLNANLQRKSEGALALCRTCEVESICDNSTESFNITHVCLRGECHGSCIIDGIFEEAETTEFCYGSVCSDDTSIGPQGKLSEVTITAVYYVNKKQFEIVEIKVICNANDCTSLNIFEDIKERLQKNLNNIKPFLPNHVNSIYSTSIIFSMIILLFQIVIFH